MLVLVLYLCFRALFRVPYLLLNVYHQNKTKRIQPEADPKCGEDPMTMINESMFYHHQQNL
jgi:hypothetical protein